MNISPVISFHNVQLSMSIIAAFNAVIDSWCYDRNTTNYMLLYSETLVINMTYYDPYQYFSLLLQWVRDKVYVLDSLTWYVTETLTR